MGGRGSSSGVSASGGLVGGEAPALSKDLVRRANAAGTVVDYGDSTSSAYARNVEEIKGFDMTASERKEAYSTLHSLTENQLRAEAKAVSPYTSGPARFNKAQVSRNAESAASARQKTNSYMDSLRKADSAKKKAASAKSFNDAFTSAYRSGVLEFTYNGETYRRKSKKSKTFTKVR